MGNISSNCKNKPSRFSSLSASPPFQQKLLNKAASTDNINDSNANHTFKNIKTIQNTEQEESLTSNSDAVSMNHLNKSNSNKYKKNETVLSSFNSSKSRLDVPIRVNKSSSASDIILLNSKNSLVHLAAENEHDSRNIVITVKKSRRKSKKPSSHSSQNLKASDQDMENNVFYSSNPLFKKRSVSRKSDSCQLNQVKNNSDDHCTDSIGNNNNNNSNDNNNRLSQSNSTHRSRRNLILDENLRINRTNHLSVTNNKSNHYHYFHHHHHHHHHSIEVEENSNKLSVKANDFDQDTDYQEDEDEDSISNYSQALSLVSNKMNRKKTRLKARDSIFNNLYNQVTNTDYKLVNEDSSNSMVSLNNFKTSIGSSVREEKEKIEENQSINNYLDLSQFDLLPVIDHIDSIKCSRIRLKKIQAALEEPDENFFQLISKNDLKRNLEYFVQVLDNVLLDEKKQVHSRLMSDDDVLSEVEPNSVPNEVRNWLSMTFTRSVTNMKKKNEDKPKFKSVAQAIRAGIMVDRMLRRMSSSLETNVPTQVSKVLKTLNDWNFEVFSMNECSDGQALRYLGFELMQKFNILQKFKIQNLVMQNFLEAVEAGYSKYKNPYHNLVHAADVLQTIYHMLNNAGLMSWLSSLEIFATFISAIIHDYEHTGTTNNFHMQTRSEIALIYNDRAVLENYHISTTFKLMTNDSFNILQELSRAEYKEFRQLVIEMVLATDMSYHFTQLKTVKNMISLNETLDKPKALSLVLHCADISHPSKHWSLHERWTNALVQEFFAQGDKEKELGLPFSPLCDRNNTPIAQSQIGFINFIVEPSMVVMGDMIDKIFEQILSEEQSRGSKSDLTDSSSEVIKTKPIERPWTEFLAQNKAKWQALADEEKKKQAEEAAANDSAENNNKTDANS